jgi:hypothetical protein
MIKQYLSKALMLLAGLSVTAPLAAQQAKPARWIEVEVIMFTRTIADDSIREEFVKQVKPVRYRRTRDLLTPYHFAKADGVFKASDACAIEQWIQGPREILPNVADTMPQPFTTLATDFDDLAPVDEEYQLPDVTKPLSIVKKDCFGQPLAPSWQIPFDLFDDHYRERDFSYAYQMFPRVIDAGEQTLNSRVHLMAPRNFKLREIYRTLRRQPNIRPILHTAWRQTGVSKRRARATRLYAGIDYSHDYDFQGQAKVKVKDVIAATQSTPNQLQPIPAPSVVDNIERLLSMVDNGATINYQTQTIEPKSNVNSSEDPDEVREIDGLMKIYIDPYNYLHIDAEFNVRREVAAQLMPEQATVESLLAQQQITQPIGEKILKNYYFNQTRRVITKQLHYFDHPYMGIIVQIRRYGW